MGEPNFSIVQSEVLDVSVLDGVQLSQPVSHSVTAYSLYLFHMLLPVVSIVLLDLEHMGHMMRNTLGEMISSPALQCWKGVLPESQERECVEVIH